MSTEYDRPADLTAIQAKMEAQKIAFSAMTFEAAVCMLRLGILKAVSDAGKAGISSGQLAEQLNISEYGVRVLLDMGLAMNLVWKNDKVTLGAFPQVPGAKELALIFSSDCQAVLGEVPLLASSPAAESM